MSKLPPVPCPLKQFDTADAFVQSSTDTEGSPSPTRSVPVRTHPWDVKPEMYKAGINMARSKLWVPLYVIVLVAVVANLVLTGVSMAVEMLDMPLVSPNRLEFAPFSSVCSGGCAAVTGATISYDFAQEAQKTGLAKWDKEGYLLLAQVAPFEISSCAVSELNETSVTLKSVNGADIGSAIVYCDYEIVVPTYTMHYKISPTFYRVSGEPRIDKVSPYVSTWVLMVYVFLFMCGILTVLLYIPAFTLRAMLRGRTTGSAPGDERFCACNTPHQVRRLMAAVIGFLVVNFLVVATQFVICAFGQHADPNNEGEYVHYTTTVTYYVILALMGFFEVCALGCSCAIYAMRV